MHYGWVMVCTVASCVALLLMHGSVAQAPSRKETQAIKKAETAFHAGYAAQQKGDLEAARAQFAKAARLAPQIPEGHEALGTVLVELGRPKEAVPEFEAAAKLKPGNEGIEADLAVALAQAGEAASAIPHFEAALRWSKEPGQTQVNPAFYEVYARALAATGEPDRAADAFASAETLTGPRADLDDEIGSLYAQMGQWTEARSRFEAAIALDSGYVPARFHLGVLLGRERDFDGSLAQFETAARMEPSDGEILFEYGRTLEAAGNDADAAQELTMAAKANPQLPGVQLELAMSLQRLGRQQDAIPWFQEAIKRDPHNSSALDNLGLALTLTGNGQRCAGPVPDGRWPKIPTTTTPIRIWGRPRYSYRSSTMRLGTLRKRWRCDPNDPDLHYDLGVTYKFLDHFDEAIAAVEPLRAAGPIFARSTLRARHFIHANRQAGRGSRAIEESRGTESG